MSAGFSHWHSFGCQLIVSLSFRNEKFYTCCDEPYLDITFNITMRRKTLFYTVNLIIPCMGISFLTVLVFYLPSDSGEKVTSFLLLVINQLNKTVMAGEPFHQHSSLIDCVLPSASRDHPSHLPRCAFAGEICTFYNDFRYIQVELGALLSTIPDTQMILHIFSICVTVVVLNVHFRSPQTHTMPPWARRVFIHILPRLLFMQRPNTQPRA